MNLVPKIAAALAVLLLASGAQAQTISMVTGNNYYPYTDERLPEGGLASLIVTTVLEEMGHTPQIDFMSWEDGYQAALEGRYVATFPYIVTDERRAQFHYSDPIFSVRPYIFVSARQSDGIREVEHLRGKTMCLPDGWGVDAYLREMVDSGDLTVLTGTNVVGCFQALRNAQVDAVSMSRQLGTIAAKAVDETSWYRAERLTGTSNSHYVLVSRGVQNGRAWLDQFNTTLRRLQSEGAILSLTREYYEGLE